MCEPDRTNRLPVCRAAAAAMLVGALLQSMPAAAQNLLGDFGDWILMGDDTMSLALTTDTENIAFGFVCGPDCHIYIEPHEPCTEAQAYPVTFETNAGALRVTMTCTASEGEPLLVMEQDKRFLPLIAKQESLRVTIAREGGRLSRFEFPLAGSEKAIGLALAASDFIVAPMDSAGLDRVARPAARERLQ